MKRILSLLAAVALLGAAATPASAATIIFTNNPLTQSGGLLSLSGDDPGDTLSVTGAKISKVGTIPPSSLLFGVTGTCSGLGCLSILTGPQVGPPVSYVHTYNGGTLTINGSIGGPSATLLSASFTGPVILERHSSHASLQGVLASGGTLSSGLALAFGVPSVIDGGVANQLFFNLRWGLSSPWATGTVSASDVQVSTGYTPTSVPEPSSLLLLGAGLVGVARRLRRL